MSQSRSVFHRERARMTQYGNAPGGGEQSCYWLQSTSVNSNGQDRPGDFVAKVKQINSQSDLIWMRSFAGPCYLTIRFSVYIILIWDLCIFNFYNLCQTGSNYIRREPQQYALPFHGINNKNTFFCYSLLLGLFQLKLFYCGKGRQNFASNVTLYTCERSRQNHLGQWTGKFVQIIECSNCSTYLVRNWCSGD